MLGMCFAALKQIRTYLIKTGDKEGLSLIEDDYQDLKKIIYGFYYRSNPGEIEDGD